MAKRLSRGGFLFDLLLLGGLMLGVLIGGLLHEIAPTLAGAAGLFVAFGLAYGFFFALHPDEQDFKEINDDWGY